MAPKIDINSDEWVDMVFENKNQAYGAYDIRKTSSKRLLKAFLISGTLFVIGICTPILIKIIAPEKKKADLSVRELTYLKLDQPKKENIQDEIVHAEQAPQPVLRSTIKFTTPVIKPDDEVKEEDEIKSQLEVIGTKAAVGTVTYKGASDVVGEVATQSNIEVATTTTSQITEEAQETFTVVEQMPEFPGGNEELFKFINNHIRYPQIALENGIQGRVICEFVVNFDGKVINAKVVRGIDPTLDTEALRVINSMPPWNPGKQRGKPVKVRYTLPVNFKLQ